MIINETDNTDASSFGSLREDVVGANDLPPGDSGKIEVMDDGLRRNDKK